MRIITCTSLSSATSTPRDNRQYALSRMSRSLVSGLLHAPTCANVPGGLARQPGDAISMVGTPVGRLVLNQGQLMGPEPTTS